jgi:hypothetical protein
MLNCSWISLLLPTPNSALPTHHQKQDKEEKNWEVNCNFSEMKLLPSILVIFTMSIFAACHRSGTPLVDSPHVINLDDTVPAVVTIDKPTDNQSFANGDTIKVEGKVTDLGLYRGNISITDDANDGILKTQDYEIHGLKEYDFSIFYKTSVTVVSNYTVTVWFEDHGLNITTKIVKVRVSP